MRLEDFENLDKTHKKIRDNYKEIKSTHLEKLGSKIVNKIISYFNREFGIYNFFTISDENSKETKEFWCKNGFRLHRIAENYFENDVDLISVFPPGNNLDAFSI